MPSSINVGRPSRKRGGTVICKFYPVTAAQTFVVGDWVYLTSNKLSICAAASNDVGNIKIMGRALANAADVLANAAGTPVAQCPVEVTQDNDEFLFAMYSATPASAITAVTDIAATFPLRNQAGQWVLNIDNQSTNDRVIVTERDVTYPNGAQYGWNWGKILVAQRQLG